MDPVASPIIAAWDPGEHNGLAAMPEDRSTLWTEVVNVDGDPDRAVAQIVDWVVSVGASELVIEWARFWASGTPQKIMAQQAQREAMLPLLYAVTAKCRALGIAVASDAAIRACRGMGLISVSRWRGVIGATAPIDPTTKRPTITRDRAVYDALVRHLGLDVVATLPTTHHRDAVGLLLGRLIAPPGVSRAGEEKRHGKDRHAYSEHRAEQGRRRAKASYWRTGRAKRMAAGAEARAAKGLPPHRQKLDAALALLAGCSGGARARWLAAQLGLPPTRIAGMFAAAMRRGEVTQPERGVYALAKKVSADH